MKTTLNRLNIPVSESNSQKRPSSLLSKFREIPNSVRSALAVLFLSTMASGCRIGEYNDGCLDGEDSYGCFINDAFDIYMPPLQEDVVFISDNGPTRPELAPAPSCECNASCECTADCNCSASCNCATNRDVIEYTDVGSEKDLGSSVIDNGSSEKDITDPSDTGSEKDPGPSVVDPGSPEKDPGSPEEVYRLQCVFNGYIKNLINNTTYTCPTTIEFREKDYDKYGHLPLFVKYTGKGRLLTVDGSRSLAMEPYSWEGNMDPSANEVYPIEGGKVVGICQNGYPLLKEIESDVDYGNIVTANCK